MNSRCFICLVALTATGMLAAQPPSSSSRILAEAQKPSTLESNLRVLTDEVGGRVPGTPAMQKAVDWAVRGLRAAGADSVHTEEFTMPVSWAEGRTQIEVTAPEKFKVRAVSIAWAPPTKGTIRARVIDIGDGSAADFAKVGDFSGAVLLVHSKVLETWGDLFNEYLEAPPIVTEAAMGKAAAIAFISTRPGSLLYRHANGLKGEIDKLPMFIAAREDGERVAQLLAAGKKVEISVSIPNKAGGPIRVQNVVGELRGSERPEEFAILGAHLDSWELGKGALDDGCNAAMVIDALRAIHASGLRPRRSIRFVLFSGEEQGMQGSFAYVKAHRAELDNAAGVLVFDEGTGKTTGFSLGGRKDVAAKVEQLVEPFKEWDATKLTTDAFVGTDNFDFLLEGVPTLVANQEAANYLANYHASSDTYDKVDFGNLKKQVALAAALTFGIADSPERLGERQKRAQVEKLLQESGLVDQLKTFDLWSAWENGQRGRAQ